MKHNSRPSSYETLALSFSIPISDLLIIPRICYLRTDSSPLLSYSGTTQLLDHGPGTKFSIHCLGIVLTILTLYLGTMQPSSHYSGTMQPFTCYLGTMQLSFHYIIWVLCNLLLIIQIRKTLPLLLNEPGAITDSTPLPSCIYPSIYFYNSVQVVTFPVYSYFQL